MHRALLRSAGLLGGAFRIGARGARAAGVAPAATTRYVEMGKGTPSQIGREFHRIEGVRKELARYPDLHRKWTTCHQGRRTSRGARQRRRPG